MTVGALFPGVKWKEPPSSSELPFPYMPLWHAQRKLHLYFTFTFIFTFTFTFTFTFLRLCKIVECLDVMSVFLQDFQVAEEFGVSEFPSLVYFEDEVPNVFEGMVSNFHF
jgi:hypothetical protein